MQNSEATAATDTDAPAAPVARRRGRPPGSRDRVPRRRQAERVEEAGAEEDEAGGEAEGGEERRQSRKEAVEQQFAELNKDVQKVRVSQNAEGLTVILNEDNVLSAALLEATAPGLEPNPGLHCAPPLQSLQSMAAVNMCWRTLPPQWANRSLPFARHTGPCVTLCRQNHTPNPPEDFRELAYLVSAVNSLPSYNGCIVPTPDTRLKWSADMQTIIGLQHVQASVEERYRQRQALGSGEAKSFLGVKLPMPDEISYAAADCAADDAEVYVSCDVAMLVVSIVPVLYSTADGVETRDTFWVATVLPQPGVDLLRCFERVGRPLSTQASDLKLAQERANRWVHLNYVEPFRCYNLQMREWDYTCSAAAVDHYTDRRHPYATMNPTATVHKVLQALPTGITTCSILGMPQLFGSRDLEDMYTVHTENWRLCVQWAAEFGRLSQALHTLKPSERRHVPPLNLPPVPGMPFHIGSERVYTLLGDPPLCMLWKPMLTTDPRVAFEEFFVGKLPLLVQGTLMAWIFGGDVQEFLGSGDHGTVSEDKIFDKYYRSRHTLLDDFMRAGCLAHWRESVMSNVCKMIEHCVDTAEDRTAVGALHLLGQDEDPNDDEVYRRDLRAAAAVAPAVPAAAVDTASEADSEACGEAEWEAVAAASSVEGPEATDELTSIEDALSEAVVKLRGYMRTAWQWHCSMISGGAYESEVVEQGNAILAAHKDTLAEDMRQFCAEYAVGAPQQPLATVRGCVAFQGAVLHINTAANMNAANLTTFRELFTTCVGVYLGSSNRSWACFFWPIQVAVAFGNLVSGTREGNVPYWVKPNSSGMDSVLVPTLLKCRKLFQVRTRDTGARAQCMVQLARATPKALEDMGRLLLDQDRVVQRPNKSVRLQLFLMTEQRRMPDTLLNALINALPRHDNATETENKVLSTDVSAHAGGARRGTEAVRIDTVKLVLCGTNVPADRLVEGECLQSLRSAMVLMPPGGTVDAGRVDRKRKLSEVHHDASKNDCGFFDSEEQRRKLCPGMCIAPLLASSLALMNDFGLVSVEVSETVNDLYAWYFWMLDTHFKWVVATAMANSVQRLLYGWKARGVADSLLYRTIGRLAQAPRGAADAAVEQTLFDSAFDAHPVFLVPTQVHQNLRGLIDGQALLVNRFVVSVLRVPLVPFEWLSDVLCGHVAPDTERCPRGRAVRQWLTAMGSQGHFLTVDGRGAVPYVSTPGAPTGAPTGDGPSLMRFASSGHPIASQVAARFVASTYAGMAQASMGVPRDSRLYRNAVQAYASMCVELSTLFNSFDIYDVPRFFDLFDAGGALPAALRDMSSSGTWELGRLTAVGSENARFCVFGVHVTAVLVASSLMSANAEGHFHNNMASNAARNVLQAVCRHSARAAMAGNSNSVHIKNFAYTDAGPRATTLLVAVKDRPDSNPREYFLRPKFDQHMNRKCRLGYLPGRFRSYAFEDTVHMHALLSFVAKLGLEPRHLRHLPAALLRCEAELVRDRVYPLVFNGSEPQTGSVCVREHDALLRVGGTARVVALEDLFARIADSHAFVYALVHRRNALVCDGSHGYGLIMPVSPGQYLDPERLEYRVRWVDGTETHVPYAALDDILQPLGGRLFVKYRSAALQCLHSELRMPEGGTLDTSVFCGNLFYPNGEHGTDTEYDSVYVNVPYFSRRDDSPLDKGHSEVYRVPLADLVLPARVEAGEFVQSSSLWIGV